MKRLLILFILFTLGGLIDCDSQDKQRELQRAELNLRTETARVFRDLNDRKHEATVRGVRVVEGDLAATHLELCYSDGYDSVQDDNHDFHTDLRQTPQLSRRRLAECDRIVRIYEKKIQRTEAEEKTKDAAYEKTHPQR